MKRRYLGLVAGLAMLVAVAAGCKQVAYGICCTSTADCDSLGLDPGTMQVACPSDEVCGHEHECIAPECSTDTDCTDPAAATCAGGLCGPCDAGHACTTGACDLGTGTCVSCVDDSTCADPTPRCNVSASSCVACLDAPDCPAAAPVCDAMACRTCKADSECPSQACADDGTCVPESGVAYLSPNGDDSGICERANPCSTFDYALSKLTTTREHLVVAQATYPIDLDTEMLVLPPVVYVHGNGSTIGADHAINGTVTVNQNEMVLRDVTIARGADYTMVVDGATVLMERVAFHEESTVVVENGSLTLRDLRMTKGDLEADANSHLTIDRAILENSSIETVGSAITLNVSNLLLFGAPFLAIDLDGGTTGSFRSSTIAYSGVIPSQSGPPFAVECGSVGFDSDIIWTPGSSSQAPPLEPTCRVTNSIVGPTKVSSFPNTDPQFVNPATSDFHLKATSPAHDAVPTGPSTDFEGDARPMGGMFDIGADEFRE